MDELKPCPFCGGEAVALYYDLKQSYGYRSNVLYPNKRGTIKCKHCEVQLPRVYKTVRYAIEVLNRRVNDGSFEAP